MHLKQVAVSATKRFKGEWGYGIPVGPLSQASVTDIDSD
jgi:hypothetical protein